MNTLKPLLVMAVLAGIGYGVYTRLNTGPETPPPGVPENWQATDVQIPGVGNPGAPAANPWNTPGVPSLPGVGGTAPSFAPPSAGGAAPAFAPPGAGGSAPRYSGSAMAPAADPTGDYRGAATEAPPLGAPPSGTGPTAFAAALDAARAEFDAGRFKDAHNQLTLWYDDPRLTPTEHEQLSVLLNQVAGTVVYSTQHVLEPPYEVQPGEQLEDIATRHEVPWQLLAKINGIEDPRALQPGERLKVVRGPFEARIHLDRHELVLLLGGCYAGRFPLAIGMEHPPMEGEFVVTQKVVDPVYHGVSRSLEASDPANPLGHRWIALGNQIGLHGTNDPSKIGQTTELGCMSLGERDVEDVYDILSLGSKVIIRR